MEPWSSGKDTPLSMGRTLGSIPAGSTKIQGRGEGSKPSGSTKTKERKWKIFHLLLQQHIIST